MNEIANAPDEPSKGQESIDRRAWSRGRQIQVSLLAAVVVLIGIGVAYVGGRAFAKQDAPTGGSPPPPGTFRATPQQMKTLTVEVVATHDFVSEERTEGKIAVNGDRSTPLFSPYSGRVTRVIAGLGDVVRQGAPLAIVEATEFVQAQNDLNTAVAQVKLAQITETRKHGLYDAKGGSLQDWQQAQTDLVAAETALDSVRNRLRILGRTDAQIAELESSKQMNPVATLTAPIAGVVVDRQVGPGQFLQSGSATPVFTIADPSSVWLLANVRESDVGLVHPGQAVEVRVPAYPSRVFSARVTYVAAIIDANTHRLPVRAEIDNRDGALKPEMFASFRILTSGATLSPAVPDMAVVYEGDTAHVWVVAGDGLLSLRTIRAGRNNDGLVEVLDGLKPGEKIVTKGGLFIDQVATPAAS
jgi:cobalt-zinc-cadmium efflux system membrane fusion protein